MALVCLAPFTGGSGEEIRKMKTQTVKAGVISVKEKLHTHPEPTLEQL